MKFIPLLAIFIWISSQSIAQDYSKYNILPPLDIPMKLSGTFGELRSNHFHSGIDLKTGEREGLKVYSIADGYVSRIKVQSGGYGRALYITHPDGIVSVYGHLSKYNSGIEEYVINQQYEKQSYEVDLYPSSGMFQVKQGEIVALSGNTGRSGGPHLHFEIRGSRDQKPINPLLFNYTVSDNVPPIINLLKVFEMGEPTEPNQSQASREYFTVYNGKNYLVKGNDTLKISGKVYFGINTYDPFNGGINKNGVYSIQLYMDDVLVYGHHLKTFSFDETRYINSLIDYKEYKEKSRRVQKSIVEPNNKLSIYSKRNMKGFEIKAGDKKEVRYEVADIAGNISTLKFWIKGTEKQPLTKNNKNDEKSGQLFSYQQNNVFEENGIKLEVPGNALYDVLFFEYAQNSSLPNSYSETHQLHYNYVALQSWCKLTIKTNNLPVHLQNKAIVVKIKKDGSFSSCGGKYQQGYINTRIREFGNYCVIADTVPPEVKPLNIHNNKSLLAQNTIRIKIEDKLSGIQSYNAYLNEKWVLMEFDAKNDLLIYRFDHKLKDGENMFKLIVSDECKNTTSYEAKLTY